MSNSDLIYQVEDMIKKYNKKPEKKIRKRDIVSLFQKCQIIVPVKTGFDHCNISGEYIEGVVFKPDVVKDGRRTRLMAVFTTYEQIPRDYMDNFTLVRMDATAAYSYMNQCEDLDGLVINPFTEYNLELRRKNKPENDIGNTKKYNSKVTQRQQAVIIHNNKKYVINKTPFTIGREDANIVIPETYISKIHVVISFKDGKYRIADYDSTNGTAINGTTLRPKVYYELMDGYEIELADKETLLFYRS